MFFAGIAGILMPYLLILGIVLTFTLTLKTDEVYAISNDTGKFNQSISPDFQVISAEKCFHYDSHDQDFNTETQHLKPVLINAETLKFIFIDRYKPNIYFYNFSGTSPPQLI